MSEVRPVGDDAEGETRPDGPIVVVTAVHLSRRARESLAEQLGPGHVVRDIKEAGNTADIVIVPGMSGTGVGALRGMFPGARILVGEFADTQTGVDVGGPMRRLIDSGIDGYFIAPDLAAVAEITRDAVRGRPVGILGTGPSGGARPELDPAPPRGGALHLVAADQLDDHADRLDAIVLDPARWTSVLELDRDRPDRCSAMLWQVALQLLERGVDVVTSEQRWVEPARAAGVVTRTS